MTLYSAPTGVCVMLSMLFHSHSLRNPILQLAIFIGTMGVMEGRQISGIQKKYGPCPLQMCHLMCQPFVASPADMYRPALIANWEVWPAVQVRKISVVLLHHSYNRLSSYSSSLIFVLCHLHTAFLFRLRQGYSGHFICPF
jgi:hypothetical protein